MFSWLFGSRKKQVPVIRHTGDGNHEFNIVGESYRMDNIRTIVGPVEETSEWITKETVAHMVPVSDNPHDQNAVEIRINDIHVGFLDRASAVVYRQAVGDKVTLVDAKIVGKWTPEGGNFGVKLDID